MTKRGKEKEIMISKGRVFSVLSLFGVLFALGLFPQKSIAQEFPTKPITLIIRSGAGGSADVMARLIAKAAEKELGQAIVCENRPGAGGVLGTAYVLKSKPDGYTIGVTSTNAFINSPHMEQVPYDPLTDSTDIMAFLKTTHALVVRTDAPWKNFEEVVAYARQNPGMFIYANGGGVGSTQHIVMERIAMKEGIKWSMVPFKSGTESVLACLGGHVNAVAASGPADVVPHIAAGKLRLLLALNDNRWQIAPNIPTVQEKYGFYGMSCQGIYGPRGIPENIREKLQNGFKNAMNDPSFIEGAKALQMVVVYMSGKDYEKWWKSQYEVMGKTIRDLGLGKK